MPLVTEFQTIAGMFQGVASFYAGSQKEAFRRKVEGKYVGVSYGEFSEDVEAFALSLRALGLSRGDRIGIMSENRLEWVVADFACACSGITDVPIFTILTPEQIAYIFNNAHVRGVICSNAFQLTKLLKIADQIPTLDHVIVIRDDAIPENPNPTRFRLHRYSTLLTEGGKLARAVPGQLDELIARVMPDDLLTLIYTSGTTGNPKGVMLTHHNLVSNIIGAAGAIRIGDDDVVLSYLPLCHSFERMAGYYTCFGCGATIAFADSIETLPENLREVHPTLMTSVPRFFERFKNRIEKEALKKSERDQKIFRWAVETGRKHFRAIERKGRAGFFLRAKYSIADTLVFSKIRERTGGRLRFFVSGGAALPRDVGEFFFAVGLTIIEGYGLTESSPVISANPLERPKLGTVGLPLANLEVRIAGDGEILVRGDNVMAGYYEDPQGTAEAIDPDGWLHTGDIGELDRDGYLRITDRKKHLFVSSGGKNIAPGPIEDLIGSSPLIEQLMLIGDDRPFIAALIVPNFEVLKQTLNEQGIPVGTISDPAVRLELTDSDIVQGLIDADIRRLQRELAAFERVRRFELVSDEFTVENGMLTPTLKVKRKEVLKAFANVIEEMYAGVEID